MAPLPVRSDRPLASRRGRAVLQQARDSGAVDQRRHADGEDDAAFLHRFRANEVRRWLSLIASNLRNLWRRLVLPARVGN